MTDLLEAREAEGLVAAPEEQAARRRPAARRELLRPSVLLSLLVLAIVLLAVLWPSLLAPGSAYDGDYLVKMQPPSPEHLFGTDQLGRDVFTRVVHGASLTLQATLLAVLLALVAGSTLGLLAGYLQGWVDDVVMRIVDVLLAIPNLLLSLAIVTVLGRGTVNIAIAVGVSSIAVFARITRAEVIRVRNADFIEASRVIGVRHAGVLFRHALPNAVTPTFALATLEIGGAIIAVSSLSFLGFGAPLPQPEWGALVSEGWNYLATGWWLAVLPCLVISVVVVATNRLGRTFERQGGLR